MRSSPPLYPVYCILSSVLLLGCGDMTLYRAGSDYYPLHEGSRWSYSDGTFSYLDSVAGDSTVGGRSAIVVLRSFAPEFWLRSASEARRYVRRTLIRNGQEYEIEARFALEYSFPLVQGASWAESFRDTVVLQGNETLYVRDSLGVWVADVEDVATPAGTFQDCYRLEVFRSVMTDTLSEHHYIEWLAPGTGLVRRLAGSDSLILLEYRSGP
jgi:hypothetical protein